MSEDNENTIEEYKLFRELQGRAEATLLQDEMCIRQLIVFLDGKDIKSVTKLDIGRYYLQLRKDVKNEKLKTSSTVIYLTMLRSFFLWLDEKNNFFENVRIKTGKPDYSHKEFVNKSDVINLLKHCKSQEHRAFIFLLWDTGARLSEITTLKINNIKFDKYGAIVTVTGKTGKRSIRIIDSVPDVQLWVNQCQGKDNDSLFPTKVTGQLTKRGAQNIINRVAKRAGIIDKHIHAHSFRHGRLTELSKLGMSEMMLRKIAGWTNSSEMPAVYININEKDIENKMLEIAGIKPVEQEQEKVKVTSKVCPRCQKNNPFDAKYCSQCSLILDITVDITEE
jgi:integrase